MQRRVVLWAILYMAAACLCRPSLTVARTRSQLPPFCSLERAEIGSDLEISRTTGDQVLDSQLSAELFHVSDVFEVMPGFVIIDDGDSPNAFATPKSLINNTVGTVLFGHTLLFNELRGHMWGGIAVAGIMAHEFGHILQFISGLDRLLTKNHPTKRLAELHADYMAGYYLGLKRLSGHMDIKAFLDSVYIKGDTDFNNKDHHGTPSNRKDVMLAGYKLGLHGRGNINDVSQQGVNTVREI